jgi:gluconokinase
VIQHPVAVVIFGVSGTGKSTIGERVATELKAKFLDADDFHSIGNLKKMASGNSLTDEDRAPWLKQLNEEMQGIQKTGDSVVLACSALKISYRETLRANLEKAYFAMLSGDFDLIKGRLNSRTHRFMPPSLLQSQFASFEPLANDEVGGIFQISDDPHQIVKAIVEKVLGTIDI